MTFETPYIGLDVVWPEVVETISEGLVIVEPEGRIAMANRAMRELTGYDTDELVGRTCLVLACDACETVRSSDNGHWCRLFAGWPEGIDRRRCHIRRRDGGWVHVQKNASVLKDAGGRIKGVVETFTDLSALVQKEREIGELNRRLGDEAGDFHGMVGRGEPMRRLFDLLEKAAQSDGPIVLYGESGVGKELAARALHCLGPNWNGPFVQLNCGALNEHLMESELFGHVKGAFTGAHRHRRGRFEAAHGGDIFLDEIGDMPPSLQVRLLRVLETKSVERVGDQRPIPANARVIAATHQDLDRLVADGLFRRDLFFRINFFPIFIPPLRDRMEDLPHLVDFFRRNMAKSMPKPIQGLTAEAWRKLERHDWPGNVRELKSVIEFGWVMCGGGYIQTDHLPPRLDGGRVDAPSPDPDPDQSAPDRRRQLIDALERTGGNRTRAARLLGVSRVTVWKWIKKYGLPDDLADG